MPGWHNDQRFAAGVNAITDGTYPVIICELTPRAACARCQVGCWYHTKHWVIQKGSPSKIAAVTIHTDATCHPLFSARNGFRIGGNGDRFRLYRVCLVQANIGADVKSQQNQQDQPNQTAKYNTQPFEELSHLGLLISKFISLLLFNILCGMSRC